MENTLSKSYSLGDVEKHSLDSLNIYGRPRTPLNLIRRDSNVFRYQLKLYCAFHKPVGYAKYYHLLVIALILCSCVLFNVFEDLFKDSAMFMMTIIDSILIAILLFETILRLWSSECIYDYRGLRGKFNYYKNYGVMRSLDFIGILTFAAFLISQAIEGEPNVIIRLLHILQVFQLYRVLFRILKIMITTIYDQFNQLYIAYLFSSITMILLSFSIYLLEGQENQRINHIFDAFWFGFATLTTIGYGDIVPESSLARIITAIVAIFGICLCALPANIFGTGLAIKLREQKRLILYRNPASKLIQNTWRCYAIHKRSKLIATWNLYRKSDKEGLNEKDKLCIRFIQKLKYLLTKQQFKISLCPKSPEEDSLAQIDLLRRVDYIQKNVHELKYKTTKFRREIHDINVTLDNIFNKLNAITSQLDI